MMSLTNMMSMATANMKMTFMFLLLLVGLILLTVSNYDPVTKKKIQESMDMHITGIVFLWVYFALLCAMVLMK